jgi:hypothetical protein
MMKVERHKCSGKIEQLCGGLWLIVVGKGKAGRNTSVRVFTGESGGGVEGGRDEHGQVEWAC